MKPRYIKNLGNWKSYTQYECYLDKMPIKTTKVMAGAYENHKFHYNPRTLPKLHEEHQRLIFPLIERCKILLNSLYLYDPRPAACDFLDFMERFITVLLQDVSQLNNIGRTHILFDHEVLNPKL